MRERRFLSHKVSFDWPSFYKNCCVLSIHYNHASKFGSKKQFAFAKIKGSCKICEATHCYNITDNPFIETVNEQGNISYVPAKDMIVDVLVEGIFHEDEEGYPDISNPVHPPQNIGFLHLKGEERQRMADIVSEKGLLATYEKQFAYINKDQIDHYNLTSVRNMNVLKTAAYEREKNLHAGETWYDSIRNTYLAMRKDFSPHYESNSQ